MGELIFFAENFTALDRFRRRMARVWVLDLFQLPEVMNTLNRITRLSLALLLLGLIYSCKKDPVPEPMPEGTTPEEFFRSLPSWDDFADNPAEAAPAPTGEAGDEVSQTVDVPQIQDDGSIDTLYNVTYTCQETPYSLSSNPEQIVMYSPDAEILWPGALIQGASHKDPIGSLRGLIIAERDSINVSIPSLPTGQNFRRVKPNQAVVAAAIGEMVGNATADNLATPSTISFSMETYHSERQMALSMGISGRYLGFSGSASGSLDRNQSETTVTVQFFQKMFEVLVEPPQTPSAFFSEEFTPEVLKAQVDLGRMGPNNLPVYVSNVVYGRMMMFSLTSTASESEIRAMMNLAYSNIAGNVQANMSAKQKTILQESKIAITSLGGDAQATIDMIRSGNWRDYFTNTAPLSSAAPLSYTFRNLGDGSIANIVETDEFTISECTEKIGVPGVFDFLPVQSENLGDIGFPVETFTGDFNGDGLDDIVLNHKSGAQNQIKLGLGQSDGRFAFQPTVMHAASPRGSWQQYDTHVADLDGDGTDDLVWSNLTADNNLTYFALSQGGSFSYSTLTERPGGGWNRYKLFFGDVDADGTEELIWNVTRNNSHNRTYVGDLNGNNQDIQISPYFDAHSASDWGDYQLLVGDIDGGGDDLIFNKTKVDNTIFSYLSNGDATFTKRGPYTRPENNWGAYEIYTAFVNNDAHVDLIYNFPSSQTNRVYTSLSDGSGGFSDFSQAQNHPDTHDWSGYHTLVGDVDGDGMDDICWTKMALGEVDNQVYTALGTSSGRYDFSPVKQVHPYNAVWSQFSAFMLDVNGDNHQDLLWIKPGGNTEYYVALAK